MVVLSFSSILQVQKANCSITYVEHIINGGFENNFVGWSNTEWTIQNNPHSGVHCAEAYSSDAFLSQGFTPVAVSSLIPNGIFGFWATSGNPYPVIDDVALDYNSSRTEHHEISTYSHSNYYYYDLLPLLNTSEIYLQGITIEVHWSSVFCDLDDVTLQTPNPFHNIIVASYEDFYPWNGLNTTFLLNGTVKTANSILEWHDNLTIGYYNFTAYPTIIYGNQTLMFEYWFISNLSDPYNTWSEYSRSFILYFDAPFEVDLYYILSVPTIHIHIFANNNPVDYASAVFINGTEYLPNAIAYFPSGTYSLDGNQTAHFPHSYYEFDYWTSSGSVSIATNESITTTTISGDGTINLYLIDNNPYLYYTDRIPVFIGLGSGFCLIFLPMLILVLAKRESTLWERIKLLFIGFMASLVLGALVWGWLMA